MAGDNPSADYVRKPARPLEGHFVVGGSGLYVHRDCLGRTFDSRTASFDLTIGLPQIGTRPDPVPPVVRQQLSEPFVPRMELRPPGWTYGARSEVESHEEELISPGWGFPPSPPDFKVYPEASTGISVILRCRFYTTLIASDGVEFEAATEVFLGELDDWWTRFTSWVGILTGQDFVNLGGSPGGIPRGYPLFTWTSGQSGKREDVRWRSFSLPSQGIPQRGLHLGELQRCVEAAGNHPPPAEWLFIRDAWSLLRAGQSRRAVLDAGTAAELAMTALIDSYLDDAQISDSAVRSTFGRFNNLIAKQEVLKLLRPGLLPKRTRADLIDLRNAASHGRGKTGRGWDNITFEQARQAVEIASAIVGLAYPLEILLTTQAT